MLTPYLDCSLQCYKLLAERRLCTCCCFAEGPTVRVGHVARSATAWEASSLGTCHTFLQSRPNEPSWQDNLEDTLCCYSCIHETQSVSVLQGASLPGKAVVAAQPQPEASGEPQVLASASEPAASEESAAADAIAQQQPQQQRPIWQVLPTLHPRFCCRR